MWERRGDSIASFHSLETVKVSKEYKHIHEWKLVAVGEGRKDWKEGRKEE